MNRCFPRAVAGQRFVETFILFLSQWSSHSIRNVEAAQRRSLIHARIHAINESFPSNLLEKRILQVAIWFNMLGDIIQIISWFVFGVLVAIRSSYPDLAVVEVDLAVFIHQTHVVR